MNKFILCSLIVFQSGLSFFSQIGSVGGGISILKPFGVFPASVGAMVRGQYNLNTQLSQSYTFRAHFYLPNRYKGKNSFVNAIDVNTSPTSIEVVPDYKLRFSSFDVTRNIGFGSENEQGFSGYIGTGISLMFARFRTTLAGVNSGLYDTKLYPSKASIIYLNFIGSGHVNYKMPWGTIFLEVNIGLPTVKSLSPVNVYFPSQANIGLFGQVMFGIQKDFY